MLSVLALIAPVFAMGALAWTDTGVADASTRNVDLCLATGVDIDPDDPTVGRGGCEYSSAEVPMLDADVCWDNGQATLKSGPCAGRGRTYHVVYGEVLDPLTSEVLAFAPLEDTCNVVPCEPMDDGMGPFDDGVACCDPYTGFCTLPNGDGECTVGEWTWCKQIEQTDDGVICHE